MTSPVPPLGRQRDQDWVTATLRPGPNGRVFNDLAVLSEPLLLLPSGVVSMFDSTDVAADPAGAPAYAGYFNGSYANMGALAARFPNATLISVTPDGASPSKDWRTGSMYIDIEPGNATASSVPAFIHAGGIGFYASPGAGPGFSVQDCINACTSAGIGRGSYRIWSAHWIGRHICGPSTCGYPQADGTQYVSTAGWDESDVMSPEFFGDSTPPPPLPPLWPIREGEKSARVGVLQQNLNRWAKEIRLSPDLTVDDDFGPATESAVKLALVYWHYSSAGVAAGVVDQSLWNHLAGAVAPPPAPPPPSLPAWQQAIYSHMPLVAPGAVNARAVRLVQELCNVAGAHPVSVDGNYGPLTESAVAAIQSAHHLTATGRTDLSTWQILAARAEGGLLPTVGEASVNFEFVKRIQAECRAHGLAITVDGVFGPATKGAVEQVQRDYLPYSQVDGIVGPVTWSCLLAFRHP